MLTQPVLRAAMGLFLWAYCASAAEAVRFTRHAAIPALYPEGPVEAGGRLLVAEMTAHRVVELVGTSTRAVWTEQGCGPTSISRIRGENLVVLCHLGGYLAIVSPQGKTLKRIYKRGDGAQIRSPNDSVSDGEGGVYLSDSGLFAENVGATGSVLYLSPALEVTRVAGGIQYANGMAIDPLTRRLYVSEHLGRRILSFQIDTPGVLKSVEVAVSRATLEEALGPLGDLAGPDGIEFFDERSFLVCIYGTGKMLRVSTSGRVLDRISVGPRYVTNISRWQERFVVTGASTNRVNPLPGYIEIYEVRR